LALRDDWIVIDFETTGSQPGAEPIEVAIVGPRGDLLLATLLRPHGKIEPAASRIHGFGASEVEKAPPFSQIYPDLMDLLAGRDVIAYGAAFDARILETACRRAALPLINGRWVCAAERYAAWRGFTTSLGIACEIEGIAVGERHRATADARLVWHLLARMALAES
jgi:DNA polymerase-3 subunit epsilon